MNEPLPESPAELDLVASATAGDLRAFETLVAKYQRAVFHIALYKSKNHSDAEDLSQDIFLAAFKALPSLKTPGSFGAWLFGIAYNRCHKWFRRERSKNLKLQEIREQAERDERVRLRAAAGGAPDTLQPIEREGEPRVSELLHRLPPDVKETLALKYLEGLSYQDIGKQLGINAHRIDYLIRKGKQMIRERLTRTGQGVLP